MWHCPALARVVQNSPPVAGRYSCFQQVTLFDANLFELKVGSFAKERSVSVFRMLNEFIPTPISNHHRIRFRRQSTNLHRRLSKISEALRFRHDHVPKICSKISFLKYHFYCGYSFEKNSTTINHPSPFFGIFTSPPFQGWE